MCYMYCTSFDFVKRVKIEHYFLKRLYKNSAVANYAKTKYGRAK